VSERDGFNVPLDTLGNSTFYAPSHREVGNKRCFCLSVTYIANNSRTKRRSVQKFGRKVRRLTCDSHTSFKVEQSKIKVTRPINADTHRAPYLPNGEAYELQTWYTDVGRRPASAMRHDLQDQMLRSQGDVISLSPLANSWPNAARVIKDGRGHTVLAEGGGHTCCISLSLRQKTETKRLTLVLVRS